MRLAKAVDHWNHVYGKSYGFKISSLEYCNLKGIGSGAVLFSGGITALCGANGVGKTTLLSAILSTLVSEKCLNENIALVKLGQASFTGKGTVGANDFSRSVQIGTDNIELEPKVLDIESIWIEVANQAPQIISLFTNMTNLDELLEGEGGKVEKSDFLKLASYVVGKQYDACTTYEIELDQYGIVPYFKVVAEGVEYGSETMGLGEISAQVILWNLNRLQKNSILLLEEPESFLSPKAQSALLDVIAKISEEKKVWVILTTHSPEILRNIPIAHIRMLVRVGGNVNVITPTRQMDYLQLLGVSPHKVGAIFVEDRAAREYAKCWLGWHSSNILHEYEVVDVGSVNNIVQHLKDFPELGKWFKVIGLFDGDQKDIIKEKYKWPYSFLPGQDPPEKQFCSLAKRKRQELADLLGRDVDKVNLSLAGVDGMDHHDWLIEFPRQMGIPYEQFISQMFILSLEDEHLRPQSEVAFKEIEKLLYPTR